MEQKMITIPFEVEKAKKIQAGELPGKIVTRKGINTRVICLDAQIAEYPIIALLTDGNEERVYMYNGSGKFYNNEKDSDEDLMLQVPEWTQFKDWDILATKYGNCFILNANGEFKTSCYAGAFNGKLIFGGAALMDSIEVMTYATDEQKQELINELKASNDPRAKEYLIRIFGIEEKPEQKFNFLQPVLVRGNPAHQWLYGNFTHMGGELHFVSGGIGYSFCIPYNEQTKHLLGTKDNWEAQ